MKSDVLVFVVHKNPVVAFLQKAYAKFWRWRNIRQCDQCEKHENKAYMNHDIHVRGWECSDCGIWRKQQYDNYDREERIKKHMRDLQELEEAKLRFAAKDGVYRG